MKQRELGTSGLSVSAVGLGCMGFSQSYIWIIFIRKVIPMRDTIILTAIVEFYHSVSGDGSGKEVV